MTYFETSQPKTASILLLILQWGTLAVLLGAGFAITGMVGMVVATIAALFVVFAVFAAKCPSAAMGSVILCLGLVPFNWGLQTGVIPKLYADGTLLLCYLAAFPFLYLVTNRSWQTGFAGLYLLLAVFICAQSLSFAVGTDLVAIRDFFETYVLGALLLILFLQESAQIEPARVGKFIVGVTVALSALSIVERLFQRNPILEGDVVYVSSDIIRITQGVYRPYLGFFHPSETGTFIAIGVPFVFRAWRQSKSWQSLAALLLIGIGLVANATRGVWVGIFVAALLELRYAWRLLVAVIPLAVAGVWTAFLAFRTSPFMQRASDPTDLYIRFEYWKVGAKIFSERPWLGVGHMQFRQTYLDYVHDLNSSLHFDIAKVFVADNIFLTTIVEHGLAGLTALLAFLVIAALMLRRFRKILDHRGLLAQAAFIRCSELALAIYVVTGCFADVHLFTKATKYLFIVVGLGLGAGARYCSMRPQTDTDPAARFREA